MAREINETSVFKIDPKKFGEGWDHIFRKRRLFFHDESGGLFETFFTEKELEKFSNSLDGAHSEDVTGVERWEEAFLNQPKE